MTGNDRYIAPLRIRDADPTFYTKAGWLTPLALRCGYVEFRGGDESGVRLEHLASGAYIVKPTGRWVRGEYNTTFHTLTEARKAFLAFDHEAANQAEKERTKRAIDSRYLKKIS